MSEVRSAGVNTEAIDRVKHTAIPRSWCWSSLESLVDSSRPICYGILMPKENVEAGVLYVKVKDFKGDQIALDSLHRTTHTIANQYRRSSLHEGDLLLSIRGTFGRVAVVPAELTGGNITQDTARVAVLSDCDPMFVAYWLRSPDCQNYFKHVARGVAVRGVNIGDLKPCPCPLAPLNEQHRIVAKIEELFSDLDAGVAALKRAKANLKRYRAAVLKAAVEGKLTAEWRAKHPTTEPASKLLERILLERRKKWETDQLAKFAAADKEPPKNWKAKYIEPSPLDTTGLPELPKGWCWVSVEHLLAEPTCNGISIKGSDTPPGIPALRLNSMTANGFDYAERRYIPISNELALELAVRLGDLFVSRGNGSLRLVGRCVLAQEPPETLVFPDTMIRLRLVALGVLREYVSLSFASRPMRRQIEKKARTTAGIYKISQRDLEEFVIPLPALAEQQQIVEYVSERFSQIDSCETTIKHGLCRATRLRQSILKQAFEGQLVAQDPDDEPASALLERIESAHICTSPGTRKQRGRTG